ncbi:hypothetical protein [Spirosoma jeollabukense]
MKTLYKRTLITILVLFCVFSAQASPEKEVWHTGHITLWDKTVLEGNLSYNWLAEMVMFRQSDGRLYTLSANQVVQFGWFDYSLHKNRDFRSLSGSPTKNHDNRTFFEVWMDGPLTVVRRLRRPHGLFKRAFGHPSNYADQPIMAQSTDLFDYYVQDAGQLMALDRFYLEIYQPLMMTYDRELQAYVQQHNINTRTLLGRLVLIDQYNSLVHKDTGTASARESVPSQE